ncbi:storkhead-box protein 1 [Coturnix japonica]|uniref:storkhead-box protein 1 n=1 Tax=Coturnix japonica TaxID=93934 RepID=UPI0007779893|nr:storkhead-box protein 1 [Coturnix japonica]
MHAQTSGGTYPALMNLCSLPQTIPLAEGICRTISDMNAEQTVVTQKTLVEQLVRRYPGIAVPSQEILYNILGTLIKARKIYHTGEGYFTVTPNTYFVTNYASECNKKDSEDTYQVNWVSCADLVKENIATVSRCLPDQNTLCEQRLGQLMSQEPTGGGKKGCSEGKPLIQTQFISSAENRPWDTMRSLISVKEKLKCRRFGLGLFWRGTAKKEKHKEYSTFSAQFPPREWPVRDEDDLDNIPRDVEHEIIRCINPTLTVDNLIKHTRLMQKLEEKKKYTTKRTSAEVLTLSEKYLSKECVQKAQIRTAKHKSKTKSNKEEQISRNNKKSHEREPTSQSEKLEENVSLLVTNQQLLDAAAESQVIYKKQIKNPFQGLSWKHNFSAKAYKGRVNSKQKSRRRKQERDLQRFTKSLDSPRAFECEAEQPLAEMQADNTKQNKLPQARRFSFQLKKNTLSDSVSYPHSSTLRIDDKQKYFLESDVFDNVHRGTVKRNPGDIKNSPDSYSEDKNVHKERAKYSLYPKGECCRYKAGTVCELLDQAANEFQNVHLSNYTTSATRDKEFGVTYRQKSDEKNELVFKYDCINYPGSTKSESDRFTNKCHLQKQKARDCDKCGLLHLDDNFGCNETHQLLSCQAFSGTRDWSKAVQKLGTALKNSKVNIYPNQYNTAVNRHDAGGYGYKGSADFAELICGSEKHQKPDPTEQSCPCSQLLPMVSRKEEETSFTECKKASAIDFCDTNEADALQSRTCEMAEVVACHTLDPQAKETRTPPGKTGLVLKNKYTVISGENHTERAENHSVTGDSGIDSPRCAEKKMKLPAKF